mmetsp:Transcript_14947/g.30816  ORF Transcript_14947/g.30816 Transcript_14947/m.30816 type:complete len:105 (-) Transcript_14947:390-704(-)
MNHGLRHNQSIYMVEVDLVFAPRAPTILPTTIGNQKLFFYHGLEQGLHTLLTRIGFLLHITNYFILPTRGQIVTLAKVGDNRLPSHIVPMFAFRHSGDIGLIQW